MAGIIIFMLVTLGVSVYFWRLVFNEPARHRALSGKWSFFKLNKEQREMDDAGMLAAALIIAIISGFVFVSIIILGIFQLFRSP